ncbi:MAG: hypothetical protein GC131_07590 [Alphaproteobacteria bacterium]|nr:hypothetical protein [Alphaproteobacteria bacterium]
MLAIGFIGVFLCVASVMLFGHDITRFMSDEMFGAGGHFSITSAAVFLQLYIPKAWAVLHNWSQTMPPGHIALTVVNFFIQLPASLIGGVIGVLLVIVGFRVKFGR